jgi:hypothetical protein
MRGRSFPTILEGCLQRLDRGENLPDLLADFPAQADQLKALLLVAMASRAFPVPIPNQTAQRLGRNQMLAEMNRLEIKEAFRKNPAIPPASRWIGALVRTARAQGFTRLAYSYRLAMVSLVLILSGGFFTLTASASSQPGDLLYNLKLGMERAGLTLSFTDQDPTNDPDRSGQASLETWEFEGYVWALDNIYTGNQDLDTDNPGSFGNDNESENLTADPDDIKQEEKDLKEAEREEVKDLKEEEKEAAKDLKEEEKEAAEAIRESKTVEKEADKIEKERVKDIKKKDK